jgi:hypothetical protein
MRLTCSDALPGRPRTADPGEKTSEGLRRRCVARRAHLRLAGRTLEPKGLPMKAGLRWWQGSDRRYLSEGSMDLLNRPGNPAEEVAQPTLIASSSTLQHLRTAARYTAGGTSPASVLGRTGPISTVAPFVHNGSTLGLEHLAARPPHSQTASQLHFAASSLRSVSLCEKALTGRRFQLCGERVNVAGARGEGSLRS